MFKYIALLLVTLATACVDPTPPAHRYEIDPGLLNYRDAERGCRALNGYLLEINSSEELELAYAMAEPVATDHDGVFTGNGLVEDPADYLVYMIGAESVVKGVLPGDTGRTGHAFCEFDE